MTCIDRAFPCLAVLALASAAIACSARAEPETTAPAPAGAQANAAQVEAPPQDCRAHAECPSGVCSHYKKDNGHCAPTECASGDRADNNQFYCDAQRTWAKSKRDGDSCATSYECFQPTCFMNPMCEVALPGEASCQDGVCVTVARPDACEEGGGKRVLAAEEWIEAEDGTCHESLAQRVLRTVCVPCGNGVCDEGESRCNCPEDCKRQ